jgi:hypothetical protein
MCRKFLGSASAALFAAAVMFATVGGAAASSVQAGAIHPAGVGCDAHKCYL